MWDRLVLDFKDFFLISAYLSALIVLLYFKAVILFFLVSQATTAVGKRRVRTGQICERVKGTKSVDGMYC